MSEYGEERGQHGDDELGRLEDGPERERDRPRPRPADPKELPRPLYRIRATHSNETFYAYFPQSNKASHGDASRDDSARAEAVDLLGAEAVPPSPAIGPGASEAALAEGVTEAPSEGLATGEGQGFEAASGAPEQLAEGSASKGEAAPAISGRTMVVVPTRYGRDICELQGEIADPGPIGKDEIVAIERVATQEDLKRAEANREREKKAFDTCKQKIASRNLPMKLVSAHYLLEEPKVLFYFSAESRVDFRELVKDLVSVFKIRIELRQIGVRDEARVTGGCGVCGRVLCCHGVTDKLVPVSIKMAKDQNLSLNSMKISGPCGRLLCCLAYEYGFYRDARRELPNEGARFQYDGTLFRVIEVNALSGSVKISGEDGRLLDMPASRFANVDGRWRVKDEEKKKDEEEEEES